MYAQTVLTALLVWPALAAGAVLAAPVRWAKHVALAGSLVEFAISVPLWWVFQPAGGMQLQLDVPWIPNWGIHYAVGVDGISLFLILLTTVALVYLVAQRTGVYSFSYFRLMGNVGELGTLAFWLFGAFFLAFAIKVPIFPFHTWLPDAHVEAPTAGSVILAAVLLKMGTYGFLRFALPLFPQVALHPAVQTAIVTLSLIGILYGGLVAMVQPDFKKLIAYSSVAHLGFVMLGIWALTLQSVQGALMVMINHGISTGALFFLVGMLYERRHTRLIEAFGGIAKVVPLFAAVLTIVSLSSIGLPATNGFVREFLVLLGAFRTYPAAAGIAAVGVIVAAMYLLPALQRIIYNPLDKRENEKLSDLSPREIAVLVPLLACIVWIGVYPAPILRRMEPAAQHLIRSVRLDAATLTPRRGSRCSSRSTTSSAKTCSCPSITCCSCSRPWG